MKSLTRERITGLPVLTVVTTRLEKEAAIYFKAVWNKKNDVEVSTFKSEVKGFFYDMQNRRCCYCSAELQPSKRTFDLEHVIDKDRRHDFMFSLKNLGNACTLCNGAKSTKRVLVNRSAVGDPLPTDSTDYWIVHPHFDEWTDHFHFDSFHRVLPQPNSIKGAFTFKICRMERLNSMRLADYFYKHNRGMIENLLKDIYRPDNKKRNLQVSTLEQIAMTLNNPLAQQIIDIVKADAAILSAMPAKYISPDGKETWSGRGKRPKWVVDYLTLGGDMEELENT